jgi:hypothetical protein
MGKNQVSIYPVKMSDYACQFAIVVDLPNPTCLSHVSHST